jgi:hypothetical protein
VRKDNGPWGYAALETNETSMVYPGEAGSTYEFYTIAYDSALNREPVPVQADARVQITNQVTSATDLLKETLQIYPNPAGSVINLHHSQGIDDLHLKLINLQGQTILQQHAFKQDHINIHFLPAGIYIINWQKGDQQGQQKLVKR